MRDNGGVDMILTNNQIYTYANILAQEFNNNTQILPIKVSFYLVKNKNLLMELAQEIERSRNILLNKYGEPSEDRTQYFISQENAEIAKKELNDLFELTQEVDIYKISLKAFNETDMLTIQQMEAIMFMIEDEE